MTAAALTSRLGGDDLAFEVASQWCQAEESDLTFGMPSRKVLFFLRAFVMALLSRGG